MRFCMKRFFNMPALTLITGILSLGVSATAYDGECAPYKLRCQLSQLQNPGTVATIIDEKVSEFTESNPDEPSLSECIGLVGMRVPGPNFGFYASFNKDAVGNIRIIDTKNNPIKNVSFEEASASKALEGSYGNFKMSCQILEN